MGVLTAATVWFSGGLLGLRIGGLMRAIAPPLAAALAMAAGVALLMALLPPDLMPLLALMLAVPLGVALYSGLLHLIAPSRLAEALHFVRHRAEAEAAEPARAETA